MQRGEGSEERTFLVCESGFCSGLLRLPPDKHCIGRLELLARALVCFSPISLLLVLARRLRVWMHWVTYEEFRQETSRRESVPSVTFYTEEKGRKAEK